MIESQPLSSILTPNEQEQLLAHPNSAARTGLRRSCILTAMLRLGLRVNEVIRLEPGAFDWDRGLATIPMPLFKTERQFLIPDDELQRLARWNDMRPSSPFFFCTLPGDRLRKRYLRSMVKQTAQAAGLTKDVCPKLLRQTCAVSLLRGGRGAQEVEEILGYRSPQPIKGYVLTAKEQPWHIDHPQIASARRTSC